MTDNGSISREHKKPDETDTQDLSEYVRPPKSVPPLNPARRPETPPSLLGSDLGLRPGGRDPSDDEDLPFPANKVWDYRTYLRTIYWPALVALAISFVLGVRLSAWVNHVFFHDAMQWWGHLIIVALCCLPVGYYVLQMSASAEKRRIDPDVDFEFEKGHIHYNRRRFNRLIRAKIETTSFEGQKLTVHVRFVERRHHAIKLVKQWHIWAMGALGLLALVLVLVNHDSRALIAGGLVMLVVIGFFWAKFVFWNGDVLVITNSGAFLVHSLPDFFWWENDRAAERLMFGTPVGATMVGPKRWWLRSFSYGTVTFDSAIDEDRAFHNMEYLPRAEESIKVLTAASQAALGN